MKKLKESVTLVAGIGLVVLFTSVSGIGCPIKWVTGISCAGCGMTRALLCAVRLQFEEAFHYHPLFWTMPFLVLFVLFGGALPHKPKKIVTWVFVICFVTVYFVRLLSPNDDVVTADPGGGLIAHLWNRFS